LSSAILFDAFKCTGCRGCQIACKQWNDLEAEETRNTGSYQNPPRLSAQTWLLMRYNEIERDGDGVTWAFGRWACMHCVHPACVSACPVAALYKTPEGPVLWDKERCIGCRYCMIACPFEIPTFEWEKGLLDQPRIRKCTLCVDRLGAGHPPACVQACPTGALKFGDRDELIAEAEARIQSHPDRYIQHVYGKEETGGTSLLYISHVPFEELGLPTLGTTPIQDRSEDSMFATPWATIGLVAGLAGVAWIVRRRQEMMSGKGQLAEQGDKEASS
jgi:formate dehydrogenase iron-sulfur subunit